MKNKFYTKKQLLSGYILKNLMYLKIYIKNVNKKLGKIRKI